MTGCAMCQLPACFCLAALFYPIALVFGDVCSSARSIPYAVMMQTGDGLCAYAGGTGTLSACTITKSLSAGMSEPLALSTTVDLAGSVRGLLGAPGMCGASSPWQPAVEALTASLQTQAYSYALDLVTSSTDGPLHSAGVQLQPALQTRVIGAVNATASTMAGWVTTLTDTTVSCTSMNRILNAFWGVPCCTVYRPFYWTASVFFILAAAIVCCGIPGGLLARKRLVTAPWGRLYRIAEHVRASGGLMDPSAEPTDAGDGKGGAPIAADKKGKGGKGGKGRAPVLTTAPVTNPLMAAEATPANTSRPALAVPVTPAAEPTYPPGME
ncbi:hypothetical protein EON68_04075, partial [archaeon]